ncbi:MAG: penicillin-resistant DD-carboxypeptidase-like protein [Cyanobacteria bacterium RYN_339]|nr:penicillin-resistant DD-carboxypeptidase-like protein [Cyanobacteria bacterium RYN_339]
MVMMKKTAPVNTANTPIFTANTGLIGNGDSGPEVKALQEALCALGFDTGKADGNFGDKTEAALQKFQASKGLPADGVLGPKTRAALENAAKAAAPKTDDTKVTNAAAEKAAEKAKQNEVLNYGKEEAKPKAQNNRLEDQKQAAQGLLNSLMQNAKVAAIALNPIFAGPALAISAQANYRAIQRYETETPQKDLNVLMAEEGAKAEKQILALPHTYAEYGMKGLQAIESAGETALGLAAAAGYAAYDYTSQAVNTALDVGGKAVDTAWDGTKKAAKWYWHFETTPIRWAGKAMSWLGGLMSGGGKAMKDVGN